MNYPASSISFQSASQSMPLQVYFRPASLWKRVLAECLDFLFLFSLLIGLYEHLNLFHFFEDPDFWPEKWADTLYHSPLLITYFALLSVFMIWALYSIEFLIFGQSLGKKCLGLKILDRHARPLSLLPRIYRLLSYWISIVLLGLGWFPLWITENRITLHDWISQTFVVEGDVVDFLD